jgi:type VI secretion system secreted protein VgrG
MLVDPERANERDRGDAQDPIPGLAGAPTPAPEVLDIGQLFRCPSRMGVSNLKILIESEEFDTSRLQVFAVSGKEAMSRLFSFDIDVVCSDPLGLDTEDLIGATASLVFEDDANAAGSTAESHRVHGIIAEVEDMLDPLASHRTYRLRLVPRAHRLTLIQTQEIFLNQTIPAIIVAKLGRVGIGTEDIDLRLTGSYPIREFVVQYKETDLAFISRLAEHLGICFFFEHSSGKDVLVFADDNTRFLAIEGAENVPFRPRGERSSVFALTARSRMIPTTFLVKEYNYLIPGVDLTGQHQISEGYAGGVLEDAPNYFTPEEGARLAQIRAEERLATRRVLAGESTIFRFHPGAKMTLEDHPRLDAAALAFIEVEHSARQVVHTHGGADEESFYRNSFRVIDVKIPYRPERVSPRPVIAGVLCARVEPQADGEIGNYAQIDTQGRYTVHFYFDPSPVGARPLSSLPVRMAQPHAGPNYGFHFPLKPGVEVLVAFADGDPDRPFIVGAVPNPVTPSPVDRHNLLFNKFQTASGVFLEIKDV